MYIKNLRGSIFLRLISISDASEIYWIIEKSKKHLTEWLTWIENIITQEDMNIAIGLDQLCHVFGPSVTQKWTIYDKGGPFLKNPNNDRLINMSVAPEFFRFLGGVAS